MSDTHALSETIGSIYDCAIDPSLWPVALERVARLFGGRTASIGISDTLTRETIIRTSWGVSEPYESSYAGYVATLPVYQSYARMQVEEAKGGAMLYDIEAFKKTDFYREWAAPQGLIDVAALCIMNDSSRFGMFGVNTGTDRPLVGERDLKILRMLAPHVRRAATISDLLDTSALSARRLEALIDGLDLGIAFVDQSMRLVHANDAARRYLDAGDGITCHAGRIGVSAPRSRDAFEHALERAGRGDAEMGRAGFSLPVPRHGGDPLVLHVLPLARGEGRRLLAPSSLAAVFITSPDARPVAAADALASLFDLTRVEAVTLTHLSAGSSPGEVASRLGMPLSTVKSQLKRIFRKTGTSRQPELVHLVSGVGFMRPTAP